MMTKAKLNSDLIATVAGDITVFNFDKETREYLHSSLEFLAVGVGIPANSCTDKPGDRKDGCTVCRTADFNEWEYVVDHRGERIYSTVSGKEITVTALGNYPPETTKNAPGTSFDKWDGASWVTDSAAEHNARIKAAEQQRIILLANADEIMADWRVMLMLGEISDADKLKLSAWMNYKTALRTLDISSAPDITWPETPEQ